MATSFARAMFENQVRAHAGKAGLAGIAAGLAFNLLIKRSPVTAMAIGGAIIAYQILNELNEVEARKKAREALVDIVEQSGPIKDQIAARAQAEKLVAAAS